MIGKLLEKDFLRGRFVTEEMKCFQDQALASLRRGEANHRGNDRSIAVSPQNRALNPQRVEHQQRLVRGPAMKVGWQRSGKARGMPMARTIWNQKARVAAQFLDLPVDGVHAITPTAVQKNGGRTGAGISVMNRHG